MDDENFAINGEQPSEPGVESNETVQTLVYEGPDYTDQLQTVIYQQQLSICLSGILLGVLISVSIVNVLKRFF